jgi:nitrogen regulatory protein PII
VIGLDSVLKEVVAIVRPERWPAVKGRLDRLPVSYSQRRVLGRRRHGSLKYMPRTGARPAGISYLPQRMICCEVDESMLDLVLHAFESDCTGRTGDGFVFVLPVAASYPIEADPLLSPLPSFDAMPAVAAPALAAEAGASLHATRQ